MARCTNLILTFQWCCGVGGYVLPVGAEFFQADFLPDPNVFAAKIAAQYVFGAQLGWFSLGGRDNQHPAMGIHELVQAMDRNSFISSDMTDSPPQFLCAASQYHVSIPSP